MRNCRNVHRRVLGDCLVSAGYLLWNAKVAGGARCNRAPFCGARCESHILLAYKTGTLALRLHDLILNPC